MRAIRRKLEPLRRHLARLSGWEPNLYVLACALAVLHVAARFYDSLRLQTLYSEYWANPSLWRNGHPGVGPWSAPLDDVFIHFDFARSAAEGHPFEWCPGNGYSSGGTSLLYPFVLAAGYLLGFRQLDLMEWAAIVACVSVFGLLLALRRAFDHLPAWTSYLMPLAILGIGALDWSLFSGMEIAFFLALWGGAFVSYHGLTNAPRTASTAELLVRSAALGLWGAALVATRPEAAATVLVFGLGAAWLLRQRGLRTVLGAVALIGAPGACVVVGTAVANFVFTGDPAAAGAIAKLELYHPFLTAHEKLDSWTFYLGYQVLRLTQEHLETIPGIGWLVWVAAFAGLLFKETRRTAALLWGCFVTWGMMVALNGQVRWQNERYCMPALAWLLAAATLGVSGALVHGLRRPRHQWRVVMAATTLLSVVTFAWQAEPNFQFQTWYFGRGSRNIYDQHVTLGRILRHEFHPLPLVLVGDAGAIPYLSRGPTLDIIGLGGYKGMPFARATRTNIGSAIELIEHIPQGERPRLLAIYPSWWEDLPLWFGKRLFEVPDRGNVICGAPSAVVYAADWDPLEGSERPFSLRPGEKVTGEFDWADLTSEAQGQYERLPNEAGRVAEKLLPNPRHPARDLFDAGRNSPEGTREAFTLGGIEPGRPLSLVFRAAPTLDEDVPVSVDGAGVGVVHLPRTDGWVEVRVNVPPTNQRRIRVELGVSSERVLFHAWAVQGR